MNYLPFDQLRKSLLVLLLVPTFFMTSCNNDEDDTSDVKASPGLNIDEAATTVKSSLIELNGGFLLHANHISEQMDELDTMGCYDMTEIDTSFSELSDSGDYYVNSDIFYSVTMICDTTQTPEYLNFTYACTLSYSNPNYTAEAEKYGSINVSGFNTSGSLLTFDLNGSQNEVLESVENSSITYTNNVIIDMENVVYNSNAAWQQIESGSGDFEVYGENNSGVSYNYNGTLVFNGDETVTLNFTSGEVVTINIYPL